MAPSIIEEGLGGVARIRVLGLLARSGEGLTRYALSTASGLGYRDIDRALRILLRIGWVEELPVNPRRYRINVRDEGVGHLLEFFHAMRYDPVPSFNIAGSILT